MKHFANFAEPAEPSQLKLKGGNNVKYEDNDYSIGEAGRSTRKGKKYQVDVTNDTTGKSKRVHWGSLAHEDFYVHGDEKRRENFLRRAGGIRTKDGKLAGENPMSPNYHALNHSW